MHSKKNSEESWKVSLYHADTKLGETDTVCRDQPGLKPELDRLQAFQNRFANKIQRDEMSSMQALNSLK